MYRRGAGRQCCVYGCSNNQKKLAQWRAMPCSEHPGFTCGSCPCVQPFRLLRFPRNPEVRQAWADATMRENFIPSDFTVICTYHFIDGEPTAENPFPTCFLGYEISATGRRYAPEIENGAEMVDETSSQKRTAEDDLNVTPSKTQRVAKQLKDVAVRVAPGNQSGGETQVYTVTPKPMPEETQQIQKREVRTVTHPARRLQDRLKKRVDGSDILIHSPVVNDSIRFKLVTRRPQKDVGEDASKDGDADKHDAEDAATADRVNSDNTSSDREDGDDSNSDTNARREQTSSSMQSSVFESHHIQKFLCDVVRDWKVAPSLEPEPAAVNTITVSDESDEDTEDAATSVEDEMSIYSSASKYEKSTVVSQPVISKKSQAKEQLGSQPSGLGVSQIGGQTRVLKVEKCSRSPQCENEGIKEFEVHDSFEKDADVCKLPRSNVHRQSTLPKRTVTLLEGQNASHKPSSATSRVGVFNYVPRQMFARYKKFPSYKDDQKSSHPGSTVLATSEQMPSVQRKSPSPDRTDNEVHDQKSNQPSKTVPAPSRQMPHVHGTSPVSSRANTEVQGQQSDQSLKTVAAPSRQMPSVHRERSLTGRTDTEAHGQGSNQSLATGPAPSRQMPSVHSESSLTGGMHTKVHSQGSNQSVATGPAPSRQMPSVPQSTFSMSHMRETIQPGEIISICSVPMPKVCGQTLPTRTGTELQHRTNSSPSTTTSPPGVSSSTPDEDADLPDESLYAGIKFVDADGIKVSPRDYPLNLQKKIAALVRTALPKYKNKSAKSITIKLRFKNPKKPQGDASVDRTDKFSTNVTVSSNKRPVESSTISLDEPVTSAGLGTSNVEVASRSTDVLRDAAPTREVVRPTVETEAEGGPPVKRAMIESEPEQERPPRNLKHILFRSQIIQKGRKPSSSVREREESASPDPSSTASAGKQAECKNRRYSKSAKGKKSATVAQILAELGASQDPDQAEGDRVKSASSCGERSDLHHSQNPDELEPTLGDRKTIKSVLSSFVCNKRPDLARNAAPLDVNRLSASLEAASLDAGIQVVDKAWHEDKIIVSDFSETSQTVALSQNIAGENQIMPFGLLHISPVTQEREYLCNFCVSKTSCASTFLTHVSLHLFYCQICSYKSFQRLSLIQHMTTSHPLRCIKSLTSLQSLTPADKRVERLDAAGALDGHLLPDEAASQLMSRRQCTECTMTFPDARTHDMHKKEHIERVDLVVICIIYFCLTCQHEEVNDIRLMKSHVHLQHSDSPMVAHSVICKFHGMKPAQFWCCPICDYTSGDTLNLSLVRHLMTWHKILDVYTQSFIEMTRDPLHFVTKKLLASAGTSLKIFYHQLVIRGMNRCLKKTDSDFRSAALADIREKIAMEEANYVRAGVVSADCLLLEKATTGPFFTPDRTLSEIMKSGNIERLSDLGNYATIIPIANFTPVENMIEIQRFYCHWFDSDFTTGLQRSCLLCPRLPASPTLSGRDLREHIYHHFGINIWECVACRARFGCLMLLYGHMQKKHQDRSLIIYQRVRRNWNGLAVPAPHPASNLTSELEAVLRSPVAKDLRRYWACPVCYRKFHRPNLASYHCWAAHPLEAISQPPIPLGRNQNSFEYADPPGIMIVQILRFEHEKKERDRLSRMTEKMFPRYLWPEKEKCGNHSRPPLTDHHWKCYYCPHNGINAWWVKGHMCSVHPRREPCCLSVDMLDFNYECRLFMCPRCKFHSFTRLAVIEHAVAQPDHYALIKQRRDIWEALNSDEHFTDYNGRHSVPVSDDNTIDLNAETAAKKVTGPAHKLGVARSRGAVCTSVKDSHVNDSGSKDIVGEHVTNSMQELRNTELVPNVSFTRPNVSISSPLDNRTDTANGTKQSARPLTSDLQEHCTSPSALSKAGNTTSKLISSEASQTSNSPESDSIVRADSSPTPLRNQSSHVASVNQQDGMVTHTKSCSPALSANSAVGSESLPHIHTSVTLTKTSSKPVLSNSVLTAVTHSSPSSNSSVTVPETCVMPQPNDPSSHSQVESNFSTVSENVASVGPSHLSSSRSAPAPGQSENVSSRQESSSAAPDHGSTNAIIVEDGQAPDTVTSPPPSSIAEFGSLRQIVAPYISPRRGSSRADSMCADAAESIPVIDLESDQDEEDVSAELSNSHSESPNFQPQQPLFTRGAGSLQVTVSADENLSVPEAVPPQEEPQSQLTARPLRNGGSPVQIVSPQEQPSSSLISTSVRGKSPVQMSPHEQMELLGGARSSRSSRSAVQSVSGTGSSLISEAMQDTETVQPNVSPQMLHRRSPLEPGTPQTAVTTPSNSTMSPKLPESSRGVVSPDTAVSDAGSDHETCIISSDSECDEETESATSSIPRSTPEPQQDTAIDTPVTGPSPVLGSPQRTASTLTEAAVYDPEPTHGTVSPLASSREMRSSRESAGVHASRPESGYRRNSSTPEIATPAAVHLEAESTSQTSPQIICSSPDTRQTVLPSVSRMPPAGPRRRKGPFFDVPQELISQSPQISDTRSGSSRQYSLRVLKPESNSHRAAFAGVRLVSQYVEVAENAVICCLNVQPESNRKTVPPLAIPESGSSQRTGSPEETMPSSEADPSNIAALVIAPDDGPAPDTVVPQVICSEFDSSHETRPVDITVLEPETSPRPAGVDLSDSESEYYDNVNPGAVPPNLELSPFVIMPE